MRAVVIAAVLGVFSVLTAVPVSADEISPGGGSTFGAHVASMTPTMPQSMGAGFGQCVSMMATTGTCPHC